MNEFTGRHMLFIMLAFFGVILAVNVTMATMASKSWSGFVERDHHIAQRQANSRLSAARLQAEAGLTARLSLEDGLVVLTVADGADATQPIEKATVTFRRPVTDRDDAEVRFVSAKAGATAMHTLADGAWIALIEAEIGRDDPFFASKRFIVEAGRIR